MPKYETFQQFNEIICPRVTYRSAKLNNCKQINPTKRWRWGIWHRFRLFCFHSIPVFVFTLNLYLIVIFCCVSKICYCKCHTLVSNHFDKIVRRMWMAFTFTRCNSVPYFRSDCLCTKKFLFEANKKSTPMRSRWMSRFQNSCKLFTAKTEHAKCCDAVACVSIRRRYLKTSKWILN